MSLDSKDVKFIEEKMKMPLRETQQKSGKKVYIFETDDKSISGRKDLLEIISKYVSGKYTKHSLSKAGVCEVGKDLIVLKPSKKSGSATELLKIQSSNLVKHGKKEPNFQWAGKEFSAYTFDNPKDLKDSIIRSVSQISTISQSVKDFLPSLFDDPTKISWSLEIEQWEKNELGKYLGELLIGYHVLSGNADSVCRGTNPFRHKRIDSFVVPSDVSFSGVDSLICIQDGFIPISSKFGGGANASFFSNLMGILLKERSRIPNGFLKDFVQSAYDIGAFDRPDRKGSEIVYEFGIREILGLNATKVPNTSNVLKAAKTKQVLDPYLANTFSKVAQLYGKSEYASFIDRDREQCITGIFSREIAKFLNSDEKSMDYLKVVLAGKDFYQANLDIKKWNEGKIEYKLKKTDSIDLKIWGNKAAFNDAYAKQGILNYQIK